MFKNVKSVKDLVLKSRVAFIIFLEAIIGIISSSFSVFTFIELREGIFSKELLEFDNMIMNFFYFHRTALLTKIMIAISTLGFEIPIVAGLFIFILTLIKKHKKEALIFALIVLLAPSLNGILKRIIQRPRPLFYPLVATSSYSFPSGHAIGSFVFYVTLSYFVYHFTKSKKLSAIAFAVSILLILLIGISRMYLGVHYPTDILAGWIGGLFWFSDLVIINRTLIFLKLFKENRNS